MAPRNPVAAAPATPPRYSLLAAAQVVDNADRWQGGFSWTPEACGTGGVLPGDCGPLDAAREAPDTPGVQWSSPFYVWAADECSTFGWQARDWQGRARRQLEATQSAQIASELWTGTLASDGDPDLAPSFAAEGVAIGTTTGTIAERMALLEAWALECGLGRRIMLHMAPHAFTLYLQQAGDPAVQITGNVAVTALGSIIVSDAGYPGTAPNGEVDSGDHWAYATPPVQVRLDQVEVLPSSLADAQGLAQSINRPTNTATVWAQRLVAYQFDPCCTFATNLGVDRPTVPSAPDPT